jgi:sulfate/thiosulfate transport system substrate-binding protein
VSRRTRPRRRGLAAFVAAVAVLLATAGGALADAKLSLVAYSTPQEAYEAIIPAFQKTKLGKGVTFEESYGASGDQSRAVQNGLSADLVALSLEPDVTRLVQAGLVSPDWNKRKYKGIVTDSVVVLTVRKGNPKKIKSWDDLIKPGVDVLIPNWQTSGGAKWDVIAAYGAQRRAGKSDQEAQDYLKALYKNVSVQDRSAREALQTFASGKGDVLIGYENEAIFAKRQGIPLDYVIPPNTILIENPVALTTAGAAKPEARAFVSFLQTPQVQALFATQGYRPVDKKILNAKRFRKLYPRVPGLFDIGRLGGWDYVNKTFFDARNGVLVKVAQQ